MTTKDKILKAALLCARDIGYNRVTRQQIAEKAGVTESLVSHHLGNMHELRTAILEHASATGDSQVLAQGLAFWDKAAREAPLSLRVKATLAILGDIE